VFGYRFITDELAADHGITASENRVARLCSAHGIFWVLARRTGHRPKPGEPVHDDRVRRSFGARAPNELWFTDITEHPTAEGTLDLCAVKDAFSARIVGYSLDSRMKASLAVAALRNAIELRRPCGTIVHSDRGSQFRAGKFVRLLGATDWSARWAAKERAPTTPPWSRSSRCRNGNVLDRQRWQTREELRLAIIVWIERTYHRRRRQRALGKLTPIEFEAVHEVAHDHALQEHGNDSYSDVTLAKDATTPLHDPQHLGHRFLGASVRALEQRVGRGPSGQAGSRSHRRTPTHWALPLAVKRRVADPAQKQSVGHSSTLLREYALGPFAPAMQQVGRVMRGRGSATRPRRRIAHIAVRDCGDLPLGRSIETYPS
jgi:putative transposase